MKYRIDVAPCAKQRGFTIIELLIVMAIGAILAAVAVPSMRDVLYNMRHSSALGLIVNDLNLARGEAIKRNARIVMCVRNAAGTDCGAGTNWQAGWLVCTSVTDPVTLVESCANPLVEPLVVRPALDAKLTLTGSAAAVRFNANSSAVAQTLTLGGTWSGAPARVVTVAVTGNISK